MTATLKRRDKNFSKENLEDSSIYALKFTEFCLMFSYSIYSAIFNFPS